MPVAAFLGGTVLLAALAARFLVAWSARALPGVMLCPFRALTGWPCPTCGGTRALAALASGRILEAAALNPMVAVLAVTLIGLALADAWRRLARRPVARRAPARREALVLRYLAVVAVLANWAYLLARA